MAKYRCKGKRSKKRRCKRKTNFIYCKQHWTKFLKSKTVFWTSIVVIGTIAGFFQDAIKPAFETITNQINPPSHWECSQDQNIRGIVFKKVYTEKRNELFLLLGLKGKQSWKINSLDNDYKEPKCALLGGKVGYECALKYRIDKKRKLYISADIFDSNHCLVGKISDNNFILNHNCQFTWNIDEKGFEVVDSDFNVVFSLHYYPPRAIAIQGVFYTGGQLVVINDNGMNTRINDNEEEVKKIKKSVKPMFEYFGKDWFGKRVQGRVVRQ